MQINKKYKKLLVISSMIGASAIMISAGVGIGYGVFHKKHTIFSMISNSSSLTYKDDEVTYTLHPSSNDEYSFFLGTQSASELIFGDDPMILCSNNLDKSLNNDMLTKVYIHGDFTFSFKLADDYISEELYDHFTMNGYVLSPTNNDSNNPNGAGNISLMCINDEEKTPTTPFITDTFVKDLSIYFDATNYADYSVDNIDTFIGNYPSPTKSIKSALAAPNDGSSLAFNVDNFGYLFEQMFYKDSGASNAASMAALLICHIGTLVNQYSSSFHGYSLGLKINDITIDQDNWIIDFIQYGTIDGVHWTSSPPTGGLSGTVSAAFYTTDESSISIAAAGNPFTFIFNDIVCTRGDGANGDSEHVADISLNYGAHTFNDKTKFPDGAGGQA